ncbi:hypothetical protein GGX14DRAFT_567095 [Mycena pura]|uniref:Uncharacterized protein n=1 Tax=Mycena pura TaxID=153505 RepID=A0AAD6VBQ2_9AGAR|nr:hypothetical protein GGX14DRAFT_567095 [Mycena pura]
MSAADKNTLQVKTRLGAERGDAAAGKLVDNIQYYDVVHEHGLGRENELKAGTACTVCEYYDPQPGAFDAQDHIDRICKQDRQSMNTASIFDDIDWLHIQNITELHFRNLHPLPRPVGQASHSLDDEFHIGALVG